MPQRYVDLSHTVADGLVTYPGLPAPAISDHLSREDSRDGRYAPGVEFNIARIDMVANTGTYLDTPFHRYPDGHDLAALPLERVAGVPGIVIGPDDDLPGDVHGIAVLVHTGWDEHWGTEHYGDPSHPFLSAALTDALVAVEPAFVGIDSVNIDDTRGGERPVHSALLAAGIPIVEHLTRLGDLPRDGFEVFAVPVKVAGMGTFPVRAFARWSE